MMGLQMVESQKELIKMRLSERVDFSNYSYEEELKIIVSLFDAVNFLFSNDPKFNDYYEYTTTVTKIFEKYGLDIEEIVLSILILSLSKKDYKLAFTAYDYLGIAYYRNNNTVRLAKFLKEYRSNFLNEPLLYELYGRLFTIRHDFSTKIITGEEFKKSLSKQEHETTGGMMLYMSSLVGTMCQAYEYYFDQKLTNKKVLKKLEILKQDKNTKNLFNYDDYFSYIDKITENDLAEESDDIYFKAEYTEHLIDETFSYLDYLTTNTTYPKYYYYRAKLYLYVQMYQGKSIDLKKIEQDVAMAIKLTNSKSSDYEERVELYNSVIDVAKNIGQVDLNKRERANFLADLSKASRPSELKYKPKKNVISKNHTYAFISYSSLDFKRIYYDMFLMNQEGIQFDYDDEMAPVSIKDTNNTPWYDIIEQKIKNAECVICYLSENYISKNIAIELKYIEKYQKPVFVVDISGNVLISKTITKAIINSKGKAEINSDTLYWLTKTFKDDVSIITASKDLNNTRHLEVLKDKLSQLNPNLVTSIDEIFGSVEGDINNHKIEDYSLCDQNNNFYLVCDGITRPLPDKNNPNRTSFNEYNEDLHYAYDVAEKFTNFAYKYFIENIISVEDDEDIKKVMQNAFIEGNKEVDNFLKTVVYPHYQKEFMDGTYTDLTFEKPGCVGVMGFINNNKLYYANFGDCTCLLVRDNQKLILADKQTNYAFNLMKDKTRLELVNTYVNKDVNGYGVVNGEASAINYFNPQVIRLKQGDEIYFMSDGISDYITYTNPKEYHDFTIVDEFFNEQRKLCKLLNKTYCDDMSLIRVKVCNYKPQNWKKK